MDESSRSLPFCNKSLHHLGGSDVWEPQPPSALGCGEPRRPSAPRCYDVREPRAPSAPWCMDEREPSAPKLKLGPCWCGSVGAEVGFDISCEYGWLSEATQLLFIGVSTSGGATPRKAPGAEETRGYRLSGKLSTPGESLLEEKAREAAEGIPSKRESSARVDYVPALCTHRPSLLPIEWSGEVFGSRRRGRFAARDVARSPLNLII
ncbi:hypothetical protein GOBAR_AA33238 [Gossypium barbadense]|uniref:Uncharacterized protein n=1 Tax=Gossypium barbadense TaxID=3634 RepID=A0A2P5W8N0_GOSBA|nr:hypothetical protein GOBAR_AA33238 [Gossypium barbadense]